MDFNMGTANSSIKQIKASQTEAFSKAETFWTSKQILPGAIICGHVYVLTER